VSVQLLKWSRCDADDQRVRSRLIKHVVRAGALVVATLVVTTPIAVFAAGNDDASKLIVADPLPGYTHDALGTLDGPIDLGTLLKLEGIDPSEVPDLFGDFTGEARTWRDPDGLPAVAIVVDCTDVDVAAEMLRGALGAQRKESGHAFDPGLDGSAGFVVEQDDLTVHTVIWRQSHYFVEVFAASPPASAASSEGVAKMLATSQAEFLRASIGAEPSIDVSQVTGDAEKGAAYRLGQILGTALLIVTPILVIMGSRRRRAKRRAHEARYALPPPVFPMPAPFGAPLPPPVPSDHTI
jgi:hypothetical protein